MSLFSLSLSHLSTLLCVAALLLLPLTHTKEREREREREERVDKGVHFLDPLYNLSWHFHPTDSVPLGHINIEKVWEYTQFTGKESWIAFSGSVPDFEHHELSGRFLEPSDELINSVKSPTTTALLSLALGNANNNVCSRGVASHADFSIHLNSNSRIYGWIRKYIALTGKVDSIAILGHESGPDGGVTNRCDACWHDLISVWGYQNLFLVSSSGVGGRENNCNYDMMTNVPNVFFVAPHTSGGVPTSYAETCAATLVSVPGGDDNLGLFTAYDGEDGCTELKDKYGHLYIFAGLLALMKEASYGQLTHRDAQHILVESSSLPPSLHHESVTNGAGYLVHPILGFGNVDALTAVKMAEGAIPYKKFLVMKDIGGSIKDTVLHPGVTTIRYTLSNEKKIRVDWVYLNFDLDHPSPHELKISLISPSGTKTVFVEPKPAKQLGKRHIMFFTNPYIRAVGNFTILNSNPTPSKWNIDFPNAKVLRLNSNCCDESTCVVPMDWRDAWTYYIFLDTPISCAYETFLENVYQTALRIHGEISISAILLKGNNTVSYHSVSRPLLLLDHETYDLVVEAFTDFSVTFEEESNYSLRLMKMSSVRYWGEAALGVWEVVVENHSQSNGISNGVTVIAQTFMYL